MKSLSKHQDKKKEKKKNNRLALISALLVILFLYFFLLAPLFSLLLAVKSLPEKIKPVKTAFTKMDFNYLPLELEHFRVYVNGVDKNVDKLKIFSFVPVLGKYLSDLKTMSSVSLDLLDTSVDFLSSLNLALPNLKYVRWGPTDNLASATEGAFLSDISSFLIKKLPNYKGKIEEINKKVSQIDSKRYPNEIKWMKKEIKVREYLEEMKKFSAGLVNSFDDLVELASLMPDLAGEKEITNYLFFLQNDKELRPSGGVLTAYALFTINRGKLVFVKTAGDVFFLDNEIRGSFLPAPDFLKLYRGTNRFYLKDAGFSADFKVSAKTAADLWSKIRGNVPINGIIVIDTHFIASLFDVISSVTVPEYGTFTKDNITEELQKFSALAGSREPKDKKTKDAVSSLLFELMNQSFIGGSRIKTGIAELTLKEALEKHLLFYFVNDEMQGLVEKYNFGGRVREYEGDYLYLSEANVGGDKSNRYIKETVKKSVDIKGGIITSTLEISYKNIGEFDPVFNREFQDYIRVYVPRGSTLINSSGSLVKVTRGEELGKTYFAGFLKVAPKSKTTFTLNYGLPNNLVVNNQYKLLIQKQPGTDLIKYSVKVGKNTEEFDLLTDKEIEITL